MNKKLIVISSLAVLSATPLLVMAAPGPINLPLNIIVDNITLLILNVFWSISVAFIVVMFTLAGFKFMTAQGDPSKVSEARQAVIWGVFGTIVVILSWSIITIVGNTFNVGV